ncbi:MAG: enoyl-CoA hydratase/isomerase family protein [Dehalococcoidia bacterium]
MSDQLLVERHDGILVLTLNRPTKHNALNRELGGAIAEELQRAEEDDTIVVAVLTGAGTQAFCAGADMGEQLNPETRGGAERAIAAAASFTKPLVGVVNGVAYGGGALLAAVCDIRYGCEASSFKFLGATYGLVVGAAHLPGIVGAAQARELIFTARTVAADEALELGLLNALYPQGDLLEEALGCATLIAANSLEALRASKQVLGMAQGNEEAWQREASYNRDLRGSAEQVERFTRAANRVLKRTDER